MSFLTPVILVVALTVGEVLSSRFHGPIALPVVLHNGYLADTPEVAAAKSAHLNTLSHQSHGGSYGNNGDSHYTQHGHHGDLRYHGPHDATHVLHDGHIADTHEVTAAKAEHYAAIAKARAHGGHHHGGDYSEEYASGYDHHSGASGTHHGYGAHAAYHGPTAKPHVLHDGHIADTHDVAAAKAEHYAAVAKARAYGGYHHGGDYSEEYASGYDHHSGASGTHHGYGAHAAYHGPTAKPHVLHDGHIADTHEVAAAKAEHYAAVAKARAHGGHGGHHDGGDYSKQYASGYEHYSGASGAHYGYGAHTSYHGPFAKPVVLPSGYLADTHEVAHVKQHHLHLLHSSKSGHDIAH